MTDLDYIALGCLAVGLIVAALWLTDLWRTRPAAVRQQCARLAFWPAMTLWLLVWVPLMLVCWLLCCAFCEASRTLEGRPE